MRSWTDIRRRAYGISATDRPYGIESSNTWGLLSLFFLDLSMRLFPSSPCDDISLRLGILSIT